MLEPIKRTRVYESVLAEILKLIESGTLKPGDQLPTERQIAERLHVSRPPVREALRSLEMMGYLESKIGAAGGNYVRQITIQNVLQPFSSMLLQQGVDVLQLLEVRLILEVQTAQMAATRRTDEDLLRIEAALDEMRSEVEGGKVGSSGNVHFHESLAVGSHNEVLAEILHMCSELLSAASNDIQMQMQDPRKALDEHQSIYLAVKDRQPESASKLMKRHIVGAKKRLEAAISPDLLRIHLNRNRPIESDTTQSK